MKCVITRTRVVIVAGLLTGSVINNATAQWSHKEGDPMPHPAGILVQPFMHAEWDASNFAPAKDLQWFRDVKEWVSIARAAGFKYIVAIAKHHDGFHLWDTAFTEFKVTNTPFKRDYLKELADACHAADMPFGIYYSQRDWYHPDYMPVDPAKVNLRAISGH